MSEPEKPSAPKPDTPSPETQAPEQQASELPSSDASNPQPLDADEHDPGTNHDLAEDVRSALQEAVDEEDSPLFGELLRSPETRQTVERMVMSAVAVFEERHSGPLPAPRQMREYEGIVPGGAERIFQMAEREQSHRHLQQQTAIGMQSKFFGHIEAREKRGQVIGAIMGASVLGIGIYLINLGHPGLATTLIMATLVGIAGVFVVGRSDKGKGDGPSSPPEE